MALAKINLPFGSGKKFLSIPFQNSSLTYNGTKQKPTWANYNSEQIKITGEIEAINAGTHLAP